MDFKAVFTLLESLSSGATLSLEGLRNQKDCTAIQQLSDFFKILTLCLCLPKYFHLWLCHAEPFRKQLGLKFTGLKYIKFSFFFPLSFEELEFKRYFAPFSY